MAGESFVLAPRNADFDEARATAQGLLDDGEIEKLLDTYGHSHQMRCDAESVVAELTTKLSTSEGLVANQDNMLLDKDNDIARLKQQLEAAESRASQAEEELEDLHRAMDEADQVNASLLVGIHAAAGMAIKERIETAKHAEVLSGLVGKMTEEPVAE